MGERIKKLLLWIGLIISVGVLLTIPIRVFIFLEDNENLSPILKIIIFIISIIIPFCFIVFSNRRLNPPKYNYKQASEMLKEIKEKSSKTIFQELQELFRNNKYLSKVLNHLALVSIVLGVIGLFTNGILFGSVALLFSTIAMAGKQKYATLGFVLAIIDILGVMVIDMSSNPESSGRTIISAIMFTIFSVIYHFYRDSQSKKSKE